MMKGRRRQVTLADRNRVHTYQYPTHAAPIPVPAKYYDLEAEEAQSEYMQALREHTKTELQSITGRMFQVLNEYEDATANESTYMKDYISDLSDQLVDLDNPSIKTNLQQMIADYKELCSERESLLYSLQEWFEQEHITEEDDIPDIDARSGMSILNSYGKKRHRHQSLQEGKKASDRLKELQGQIEEAEEREEDLSVYKDEKKKLESELVKSKLAIDKLEKAADDAAEDNDIEDTIFVTNTWRHAATDIRNMLRQVRENGLSNLQEMEEKIYEMADMMKAQEEKISMLNQEQFEYRKKIRISEDLASELTSENAFLREELDRVRGDLYESKKKITKMDRQQLKQQEAMKHNEESTMELEQRSMSLTKENGVLKNELASMKMLLEAYSKPKRNSTGKLGGRKLPEKIPNSSLETGSSTKIAQKVAEQAKLQESAAMPANASGGSGALLKYKDQQLLEKDLELEKLREQIQKQMNALEDLKNTLGCITEENQLLKDRIAKLEAIISATANKSAVASVYDTEQKNYSSGKEKSPIIANQKVRQAVHTHRQSSRNQKKILQNENQQTSAAPQNTMLIENRDETHMFEHRSQSAHVDNRLFVVAHQQPQHLDVREIMVEDIAIEELEEKVLLETVPPATTVIDNRPISGATSPILSNQPPNMVIDDGWSHHPSTDDDDAIADYSQQEPKPAITCEVPLQNDANNSGGVAAMDLVVDLMKHLNEDSVPGNLAEKDTPAIHNIQREMDRVTQLIQNFMKTSLDLVDKEVESMNVAGTHLLSNLTEREKFEVERKAYQEVQNQDFDHKHFKEKVLKFGEEAIKVLKTGEAAVESHVKSQQRKLSCVVSVMADHKKRQSKNFKFSLPVNNELEPTPTVGNQVAMQPNTNSSASEKTRSNYPQYTNAADRVRMIMMMAEGKQHMSSNGNNEFLAVGKAGMFGSAAAAKGKDRSELNLQITNSNSKKTAAAPMTLSQGKYINRHKNNRPSTAHPTTATAPTKTPKLFNPFQSSEPTWAFQKSNTQTSGTKKGHGSKRKMSSQPDGDKGAVIATPLAVRGPTFMDIYCTGPLTHNIRREQTRHGHY